MKENNKEVFEVLNINDDEFKGIINFFFYFVLVV